MFNAPLFDFALYIAPSCLMWMFAFACSLVYLRRVGVAAAFVALGSFIIIATFMTSFMIFAYLPISMRASPSMNAWNLAFTILRAVCYVLIISAAFVGRTTDQTSHVSS